MKPLSRISSGFAGTEYYLFLPEYSHLKNPGGGGGGGGLQPRTASYAYNRLAYEQFVETSVGSLQCRFET